MDSKKLNAKCESVSILAFGVVRHLFPIKRLVHVTFI